MLIIDARQKRWLAVFLGGSAAAVSLYVWLDAHAPGGLTGGSRVGLLYGIAGGLLIVLAWLLSAVRFVPSWWWIGSRAFWLKGHVWLGMLSFVLILCHSGGRFGGPLERVLYLAFALTLLTGMLGLGLQYVLPRLMTQRVPCEVPYEQIPHVCRTMKDRAEALFQTLDTAKLPGTTRSHFERFFDEALHPFLSWPSGTHILADPGEASEVFARLRALPGIATAPQDSAMEKMLEQLETFSTERRRLAEQERLQHWLHGWLYLHIPLSAVMLALGAAHVVMTLYY